MITTTGKSIIAKYLIDQAPSYAAYIAVGCGHNPRTGYSYPITAANIATNVVNVSATNHTFKLGDYVTISNVNATIDGTYPIATVTGTTHFTVNLTATNATNTGLAGVAALNFENKEKLDFEMFRVPIISRSYAIDENGVSQIVFSAELPTQELYYMSEAGIFSAGSNPVATTSDSRLLYSFSSIENWEYHTATADPITSPTDIASIDSGVMLATLPTTFFIDNTQDMFSSTIRGKKHLEQPRMLKNSIAVAGNMSNINTSATTWTTVVDTVDQPHIHLTSQSYPLDVNSSSDEIVLAFSLLKRHQDDDNPTSVFILVEFSSEESESTQQYAKMQIELSSADIAAMPSAANGNYVYFVKKKTLAELLKSSRFSWVNAKIIKVYCEVVPTTRSINNKVLTNNLATISTSAAHYVAIGDTITVALSTPDAVFDGTHTVTAVTSGATNTISYTKTNANVGTTATSGTLTRDGQSMFIALDGLRFENNFDMTANPLYGMTAYSPISTATNTTVFKDANSKNLLDMKLNLDLNVGS